jgi:hypothetical protein
MTIVAAAIIAVAVIPGTSANEDATGEVVGTVVTVRRAGVWVVTIIPIGADRGGTNPNADWTYANANRNLGIGISNSSEEQNCE